LKKYFASLAGFVILLVVINLVIQHYISLAILWFILLYFLIVTAAFHYGLLKSTKGKPKSFIQFFMAATGLRLFLHIIVILIYCLLNKQAAFPFVIAFFSCYLLFTIFEIKQAMILAKK
jgi:hypothetical protein